MPAVGKGQQSATWQQVWHDVMSADDQEDEAWEESFEWLSQLAGQPLNINQASVQELEQLPFLSPQQVVDIGEYLERYGPMRSLGELRMIKSLDYAQLQLLPFFVFAGENDKDKPSFPSLDSVFSHGRHELTAIVRVPFYTRRGDDNGYLGYRYRHEMRYALQYHDRVRLGLLGAQDAGEPFLAHRNRWGYDVYSYYLQVKDMGPVENLVIGKYKMSVGKGLLAGSSFMPGKLSSMQGLGRTPTLIRPHASRSEADYLQGAAATLRLSERLRLTPYASHRYIDATLNADGTARTLLTSGYHRTVTEMEKKYNTRSTDVGAHLDWRHGGWRAGVHAAFTHLSRSLQPDTSSLYRRYQAAGSDFLNVSVDYGYTVHGLHFSGETATDRHGHLATFHVLGWQPWGELSLMVMQRYYSYRYQALHAHAMSEGGHVQNESGVLIGATWKPRRHWQLQAYADYAYFPWVRSQVSQTASSALDFLVSSVVERRPWTVKLRYRCHLRERDNEAKDALVRRYEHRVRLNVQYASPTKLWSLATQGDCLKEDGQGWMVSQTASWQPRRLLLSATVAGFCSHVTGARLYLYERQMPHSFAFGSYTGEGVHGSLLVRYGLGRWQCHARLGYTHYFDRPVIGSGWQEVGHSSMTDLDLQLRCRLGR